MISGTNTQPPLNPWLNVGLGTPNASLTSDPEQRNISNLVPINHIFQDLYYIFWKNEFRGENMSAIPAVVQKILEDWRIPYSAADDKELFEIMQSNVEMIYNLLDRMRQFKNNKVSQHKNLHEISMIAFETMQMFQKNNFDFNDTLIDEVKIYENDSPFLLSLDFITK